MLHQACFCAICSVVSVTDWCNVSMGPKANACTSKRGALAVFKSVLHVLDRSLDQPGTAMQTRPRPGAQACTVSTRSGAVCVRGFVLFGVCCLFQIGAGLSSVNMPPWVIACSSKRGAPTVFKCGLACFGRHFGSSRHGNADPAPARGTSVHGVDSEWSGVCAWFCVIWSVLPD